MQTQRLTIQYSMIGNSLTWINEIWLEPGLVKWPARLLIHYELSSFAEMASHNFKPDLPLMHRRGIPLIHTDARLIPHNFKTARLHFFDDTGVTAQEIYETV